jgi:hypothetical protein
MAVIREKRQFFGKPIGVARTEGGAAEVGRALSNSARRISQLAYNEAAQNAEKVGKETALALGSDKIVAIDPNTNTPMAFKPPQGFGGIAAEAYQGIITRRFEDSVNDALKDRAAQVSATAPSSQAYLETMTDFVNKMYNAEGEQTMFSRYIKETGEQYVASTYASLVKKEQEAARKSLIKKSKLSLFVGNNNLKKMVVAGLSSDDFEEMALKQQTLLQDLFDSDSMSITEYTRNLEEINSIRSLQGSSQLFSIYGGMSESEKNQVRRAIQRPDLMATLPMNLQELIVTSKMATGTPTLLSALDSYSATEDAYVESASDELFTELRPNITATTTDAELSALIDEDVDPDVREEVKAEARAVRLEMQIDNKLVDANSIDLLSNELKKSGEMDESVLSTIFNGNESLIQEVQRLTPKQREDFANSISDRRSELQRIQANEEGQLEYDFRQRGLKLEDSNDINADYQKLRKEIEDSGLSNFSSIISNLDDNYARLASTRASRLGLSESDLVELRDAVIVGNPSGLNVEQMNAYRLFRSSYVLNPSATRGAMQATVDAVHSENQRTIKTLRTDSVRYAVENGIYPAKEDMVEYDNEMLGGLVLTMRTLEDFPHAVNALKNGVVLPSVQRALEASVNSFNEDDLVAATEVFGLLTNSEGVMNDGTVRQIDLLRGRISDNAYALLSAANQIGRMDGIPPLAALLELKNYSGNLEDDIKSDLDYKGSFNAIMAPYPMSDVYRKEILNVIKMRKVRGAVITPELIESVIEDYSDGMIKDDNVIAPRIGDATIYAPSNFGITVNDIVSNRFNLIEALSDQMENDLLVNDTPVAAAGNQIIALLGRSVFKDLITTTQANIELFTKGYDKNVEMVRRQRIKSGLEELNFEVKYKPIFQSFREGAPTWQVGYVTKTGEFYPVEIDGQPYLLQANVEDFASADIRFERLQSLNNLIASGAPEVALATAELKYDASLKHLDPTTFAANEDKVSEYMRRMGLDRDQILNMFNNYRYDYLVGSSEEITEGR